MFYLTYNYTNARQSRMAIACVIRCKNTYGKQLAGQSAGCTMQHLNRGKRKVRPICTTAKWL